MIKEFNLLDQITIYASSNLTADDVTTISLLYNPLIKENAFKLYMTLSSLVTRSGLVSQTYLHKELLDILGMKANELYHARIRLEAIGLLSTYKNEKDYLFMLKSPLTSKQFLSDGVLGMYLYSEIGDTEFKKIQKLFQIPRVDKANFTEITASFDDVFVSTEDIAIQNEELLLDRKINTGIKIKNYDFNFDLFQSGIAKTFLDGRRITKRFETFIINIAYAYGFDEATMQDIYNKSLNTSGSFDYTLCSKKAREKYEQVHNASLPKIAEKPELKMSEMEELFATLPAKTILETATGSKLALPNDCQKMEQLYQEYSYLPRSLVNVCVVYSIKKCNGEVPAYNYFDVVLKDWVSKGINTFEMAQEYAFKETETQPKSKGTKKKTSKTGPAWLTDYVNNFESEVEDL